MNLKNVSLQDFLDSLYEPADIVGEKDAAGCTIKYASRLALNSGRLDGTYFQSIEDAREFWRASQDQ